MTNKNTMSNTKVRHSQPFRTPEGYLEALPDRIMARIDAEQARRTETRCPSRARIINIYMRYATGIAAAVAFFVMYSQSGVARMEENAAATQTETRLASASDMVYDYMLLDDQTLYDYDDAEE